MSNFLKQKRELPNLGIGLGLRRELFEQTLVHRNQIDWLEIVPENYMKIGGKARSIIESASKSFPLISHGVNLSIGSFDELNQEYLVDLKELLDEFDIAWFSDHLCFTSVNGGYLNDLLPLPFSRQAVRVVVDKVKRVQDFIQRPFLLENISFYMYLPGREMQETEFINEILDKADCGLLFDVNNLFVNATNHNFDPIRFLDNLNLERVVQIHVAGHKQGKEVIIDTHGEAIIEPVYQLLEEVLKRTKVNAVMLERDQNFPEFEEILAELSALGKIARRIQPELLEGKHYATSVA